jgi:hypothetical protein
MRLTPTFSHNRNGCIAFFGHDTTATWNSLDSGGIALGNPVSYATPQTALNIVQAPNNLATIGGVLSAASDWGGFAIELKYSDTFVTEPATPEDEFQWWTPRVKKAFYLRNVEGLDGTFAPAIGAAFSGTNGSAAAASYGVKFYQLRNGVMTLFAEARPVGTLATVLTYTSTLAVNGYCNPTYFFPDDRIVAIPVLMPWTVLVPGYMLRLIYDGNNAGTNRSFFDIAEATEWKTEAEPPTEPRANSGLLMQVQG